MCVCRDERYERTMYYIEVRDRKRRFHHSTVSWKEDGNNRSIYIQSTNIHVNRVLLSY